MFKVTRACTIKYFVYFTGALLFTLANSNNSFFWDSVVQVSIPANFYFKNNFSNLFLPSISATGHQPFIGMYVALMWKLFGRNLLVSHMAMMPFIFGILFQIDKIVFRSNLKKVQSYLIILVVVCDATFLSQMSMITFDIPHIFFFLWCINSFLDNKKTDLSVAFAFLMLMSLRAVLSGIGIILFSFISSLRIKNRMSIKEILPFIPGLLFFIVFMALFFRENGWIVFNTSSPDYKEFGRFASFPEILRNIGLVGWRLIDFGRVGIWMVFLFIIFISLKRRTLFDDFYRNLFFITICQFAVFFMVVILFGNPFGHRYFLPVIIPVSMAVTYWVIKYSHYGFKLYSLLTAILISGYFWIYPLRIAKGWDATPAHWPYFSVLREMTDKITKAGIVFTDIGSFFPIQGITENMDLKGTGVYIHEADLYTDEYILFSNVCNIDDIYIDELFDRSRWQQLIAVRQNRVFMILFCKIRSTKPHPAGPSPIISGNR